MDNLQNNTSGTPSPEKSLVTLRIIWAALLFGELLLMAVMFLQVLPKQATIANPQPVFSWVSLGMLVTIVPAAFLLRTLFFSRARQSNPIKTGMIVTGSIIFWAGCEVVGYFAIVAMMLNGSAMPTILYAAVAMSCQLATFPRSADLFAQ